MLATLPCAKFTVVRKARTGRCLRKQGGERVRCALEVFVSGLLVEMRCLATEYVCSTLVGHRLIILSFGSWSDRVVMRTASCTLGRRFFIISHFFV